MTPKIVLHKKVPLFNFACYYPSQNDISIKKFLVILQRIIKSFENFGCTLKMFEVQMAKWLETLKNGIVQTGWKGDNLLQLLQHNMVDEESPIVRSIFQLYRYICFMQDLMSMYISDYYQKKRRSLRRHVHKAATCHLLYYMPWINKHFFSVLIKQCPQRSTFLRNVSKRRTEQAVVYDMLRIKLSLKAVKETLENVLMETGEDLDDLFSE